MKIEVTPDVAVWIEAEVAAGTFATPEDAVRFAIQRAKATALREKIEAAIAEGGSNTAEDVRQYVREHLARSAVRAQEE